MIEKWTNEQTLILLAIVLGVLIVELSALLSTMVACSRTKKSKKKHASAFTSAQTLSPFSESEHEFGKFYNIFSLLFLHTKIYLVFLCFIQSILTCLQVFGTRKFKLV